MEALREELAGFGAALEKDDPRAWFEQASARVGAARERKRSRQKAAEELSRKEVELRMRVQTQEAHARTVSAQTEEESRRRAAVEEARGLAARSEEDLARRWQSLLDALRARATDIPPVLEPGPRSAPALELLLSALEAWADEQRATWRTAEEAARTAQQTLRTAEDRKRKRSS